MTMQNGSPRPTRSFEALHLSRACQCFFSTKLGKVMELICPFLKRMGQRSNLKELVKAIGVDLNGN